MGCDDVDECQLNPCSGTTCINTYGSYYCLTSSDVSSGSVAALVGGEAAAASTVSNSTLALAAVLAAVGSAMIVLIVVLAVRRIQTSRAITENQSTVNRMNHVGASPYGFNVEGKFQMPEDDALSSVSSTGTIH